jgi:hypothetical protein
MKSLYDVFCAIKADEGDHMSTMKACLDSDVSVRSASLEKKILTGMALAAAVYIFLSDGEMSGVINGVDQAGDVAGSLGLDTVVEAALASVAGLSNGLLEDEEGVASTAVALEGLRRFGTLAIEFFERFILEFLL